MYHETVLRAESLAALAIKADGCYLDCTVGGGGHSQAILDQLSDEGTLIYLDQDQASLDYVASRLRGRAKQIAVHANFKNVEAVLADLGIEKIDGLIADLGVSSAQLDQRERGFSFRQDAKLDMRMDQSQEFSAFDLVNKYQEEELKRIFFNYGEERYGSRIARAICRHRPIETTLELVDIITNALPKKARWQNKHPAKRCFQAIRIEVNAELAALEALLASLGTILKIGGRAAIISFHSLEDRLVKRAMREYENPCTCPYDSPCICQKQPLGYQLMRKGQTASEAEIKRNPRSRSARLRCFVRGGKDESKISKKS